MSHRSFLPMRSREVVDPSPLRAMHSIMRSRTDMPRRLSASLAGLLTGTPARSNRASTAALRNSSPWPSSVRVPTGPPWEIMNSTAAWRTWSMVWPPRMYSAGSMPTCRHRATMSLLRWRSACTAACRVASFPPSWPSAPAGSPAPRLPSAGGSPPPWFPSWPPAFRAASIFPWSWSNSACSSRVRPRPSFRAPATIARCLAIIS